MRILVSAVAFMLVLGVSSAFAAGYGTAGCGLGSVLIGPGGGIAQVFAATLNGISGNQTLGITFGTSNCGAPAKVGQKARVFIEANREALAKDMARGAGETINGLSSIAGCKDSARVGAALQKNYAKVFPAASVSDKRVTQTVVTMLKTDSSLMCTAI